MLTHENENSAVSYNSAVKQTIFAVEDDTDISRLVRHHLEGAGYAVRTFTSASGVVAEAEKQPPSLFLLDIMIPGETAWNCAGGSARQRPIAMVPVIFLTARISESDKVIGLELGADDYIPKPFSPRELVARIRAVLRRFERPLAPAIVKAGDIEIDSGGMTLTVRGVLTQTTATEFRLLEYLARHPGRVFTRDQLLDAVWRDTHYVTPRSVDVYVRRIREKIEANPDEPRYLKTVRGAGYRFEVPKP